MADWQLCSTPPGAASRPHELQKLDVRWFPATVPGTAASALRSSGAWNLDDDRDFDAEDWWWRGTFAIDAAGASWWLDIGGIATIADVWFDGEHVLHSESMFLRHTVDVGALETGSHDVVIRCAALNPLLAAKRPRPRWRTRLVRDQNLRWVRTSLFGRMPGWVGNGAPVGPWRGVELVQTPEVLSSCLRSRVDGTRGVVDVTVHLREPGSQPITLCVGDASVEARIDGTTVTGTVEMGAVELWWPHTHGVPTLYDVALVIDERTHSLGRVGFRTIDVSTADDGFAIAVNGESVFCRGANWIPIDIAALSASRETLRDALDDVVRANMNMVRISGATAYEATDFHDLCDELGILVWQDVMLANMDPPDDESFLASVDAEVEQLLDRLAHRPSLAVLCGGNEIEQQAAMMGLAAERRHIPLIEERIPAIIDASAPDVAYVSSTPSGGTFPFSSDTGVAHYYGVGAYRRPLDDARLARVRFATECLAFSNVSNVSKHATVDDSWARGVPRDSGADWSFEDTRDHYARELFDVDTDRLRVDNPERYIELGRIVTGHVMAKTIAAWRRPDSTCRGALIWNLRDVRPGPGWGLVDVAGQPKAAWWYTRRAMAPVGVFAVDEGLNGLDVHVVNDTRAPLDAVLRVELFVRGELRSEVAEQTLRVEPGVEVVEADALFDGFRDLTWAYRFGEASYDVIAATLFDTKGDVLARDVHLPLGLSREREHDVGLSATAHSTAGGWCLRLASRRFAQAVSLDIPGYDLSDNWFDLPPATEYVVGLVGRDPDAAPPSGQARAINASNVAIVEVGQ